MGFVTREAFASRVSVFYRCNPCEDGFVRLYKRAERVYNNLKKPHGVELV